MSGIHCLVRQNIQILCRSHTNEIYNGCAGGMVEESAHVSGLIAYLQSLQSSLARRPDGTPGARLRLERGWLGSLADSLVRAMFFEADFADRWATEALHWLLESGDKLHVILSHWVRLRARCACVPGSKQGAPRLLRAVLFLDDGRCVFKSGHCQQNCTTTNADARAECCQIRSTRVTNCHANVRVVQIYRALRPQLRPDACGALLAGLWRCLAPPDAANVATAAQLMVTLQARSRRGLHLYRPACHSKCAMFDTAFSPSACFPAARSNSRVRSHTQALVEATPAETVLLYPHVLLACFTLLALPSVTIFERALGVLIAVR